VSIGGYSCGTAQSLHGQFALVVFSFQVVLSNVCRRSGALGCNIVSGTSPTTSESLPLMYPAVSLVQDEVAHLSPER
jgi:hypothetical protein